KFEKKNWTTIRNLLRRVIVKCCGLSVSFQNFLDVYEDTVYYVSEARMRIVKIGLRSKKIEFMGKEPKNFQALSMNKKTKAALKNPRTDKEVAEEIMTWQRNREDTVYTVSPNTISRGSRFHRKG
ncbi:MAG: hypothetical protein ACOC6P_02755, partial [Candidatus Aminicenantaceae bacterium]